MGAYAGTWRTGACYDEVTSGATGPWASRGPAERAQGSGWRGSHDGGGHRAGPRRGQKDVDIERGLVGRRNSPIRASTSWSWSRSSPAAGSTSRHESQIPQARATTSRQYGRGPGDRRRAMRTAHPRLPQQLPPSRQPGLPRRPGPRHRFLCPYHGWTYDTGGQLIGMPGFKEFYHEELDRAEWGLMPVAQVDTYRGLIFGDVGPRGAAAGRVPGRHALGTRPAARPGRHGADSRASLRCTINCNWKFAADNAIGDMYHGQIAHRSASSPATRAANGTGAVAHASTAPPAPGLLVRRGVWPRIQRRLRRAERFN